MKAVNFPVWLLTICMIAAALAPERALAQNRLTMEPPPRVRLKVAAQPDGRGMIKFGTPQVYSRQVVFRDRTEEIQYLSDRLKEIKNLPQSLQGLVDTRDYQALGMLLDLAKGTTGNTLEPPQEGENGTAINRVEIPAHAPDTEPDVMKQGGAAAKATGAVLTPIEQEKAVIELRRFLQNERRRLNFDDMHDATGAVAVDLGMLVTLVPPAGEDAYAIIEAYATPYGSGHNTDGFRRIDREHTLESGKAGYEAPLWQPTYEKVNTSALLDEQMRKAWGDYLLSAIQTERDFLEMRVVSNALPFGEKHFQLAVEELNRQAEKKNKCDAERKELLGLMRKDAESRAKDAEKAVTESTQKLTDLKQQRMVVEGLIQTVPQEIPLARVKLERARAKYQKARQLTGNNERERQAARDAQDRDLKAQVEAEAALRKLEQEEPGLRTKLIELDEKIQAATLQVDAAKAIKEQADAVMADLDKPSTTSGSSSANPEPSKWLGRTFSSPVISSSVSNANEKEATVIAPQITEQPAALGSVSPAELTASVRTGNEAAFIRQLEGLTISEATPGSGAVAVLDVAERDKIISGMDESKKLFYHFALNGGLTNLEIYKNKTLPAALDAAVQTYKERLLAQYLKLYFDCIIPNDVLKEGDFGALKTRKCEMVENARRKIDELRSLNIDGDSVRVLSVDPADQGQNISNVGATQSVSDIVLSLSAFLPESKASGRLDYYRDNRQFLQSANRKPVAVGFVNGDAEFPSFGWVLGPRFEVQLKRPWYKLGMGRPRAEAGYTHEPTQHQVQVSLGMMAWMPGLNLELRGHWVSKRTGLPVTPILTSCHVPVKMTPDYAAMTEGLLDMIHGRRRPPRILITNHKEMFTLSSQGDKHTLVLLGKDMWRSPSVSLDSLPADSVEVLPGLTGVVATFNHALPPSNDPYYDVTISTTDGYDVIYNRVAAPVRGSAGAGAVAGVRVELDSNVIEVNGKLGEQTITASLKVLENKLPVPAYMFLRGGFFPAKSEAIPVDGVIGAGAESKIELSLAEGKTLKDIKGLIPAGSDPAAVRLGFTVTVPIRNASQDAPTMINVLQGINTLLVINKTKTTFGLRPGQLPLLGAYRPELGVIFPAGMSPAIFAEAYPTFVHSAKRGNLRLRLQLNPSGVVVECLMNRPVADVSQGLSFQLPTLQEVKDAGVTQGDNDTEVKCTGTLMDEAGKTFETVEIKLKIPKKPSS